MQAIRKLRFIKNHVDKLEPEDVVDLFTVKLDAQAIAYNILLIIEGKGKGRVEMVLDGEEYAFPVDCAAFVKELFAENAQDVTGYIYYPWWTGAKFIDIYLRRNGENPIFVRLGVHSDGGALPKLNEVYQKLKAKVKGD